MPEFPLITSQCLDDTEWGQQLVEEFGRITAEKIALFLNRNGYSFRMPLAVDKLMAGNFDINFMFYDKHQDVVPYSRWHSVEVCDVKIAVDGEIDYNIDSIEFPVIEKGRQKPLSVQVRYCARGRKPMDDIHDDKDLTKVDFEVLKKSTYHINRMKVDDHLKKQLISTVVQDYLRNAKINVKVDKVCEVLESLK